MNFKNRTDDVICIYDLLRKDLGVPVRFAPNEVLDLYTLCGRREVGRSELLREYMRKGLISLTTAPPTERKAKRSARKFKAFIFSTPLTEVLDKDSEELEDRFREAVEVAPLSPVFDGVKGVFVCGRCQDEVKFADFKAYCPSCGLSWSPILLLDMLEKLEERVAELRRRLVAVAREGSSQHLPGGKREKVSLCCEE